MAIGPRRRARRDEHCLDANSSIYQMKTCPQCNVAYTDDYMFCLADGNSLVDESGEQETIAAGRVMFSDMQPLAGTAANVACKSCGLENRSNSKFCKKCGKTISSVGASAEMPYNFISAPEPTVVFQPSRFEPPQLGAPAKTVVNGNQTTIIIMLALLATLVVIIVAVVAVSNSGSSAGNNNADRGTKKVASPDSPNIGRKGTLTTNQHIRIDANRYAQSLGVHYQDARLEVLDERSFMTDDGTRATWYRVRILENGCDREDGQGCGNDRDRVQGAAALEGWMNAKNIILN